MDVYKRLEELGIQLVPAARATGAYVTGVQFGGDLLYFSGAGPLQHDGKFDYTGKVGADLDLKTAYEAARSVGITMLSNIHAQLGDLNRVTKIVKVTGFVNSAPDFCEQHKVINGFSELMLEVFGSGIASHSRSAVGVAALPGNIPAEVEMLIQYK